ncbi:MAG: hypothetical protein HY707_05555 [Ignavibacteriae bacterium]|nr:hypothetical protein [Ignavibacteriota bacterium]
MKILITLMIAFALMLFIFSPSSAQVAGEKQLNARIISDGQILVGANSTSSQAGPYFGGSIGYGIGYGVTLYVESGYGWTNYHSVDGLRLVQVPVLGGLTYNFGDLWKSSNFQPYVGASAGVFNYLLQQNWNTITVNGSEQKTTNFGVEGTAGINYLIPNSNVGIDIRAKFDHVFSNRDNGNALEQQEWSNVGIGGGVSYYFSL